MAEYIERELLIVRLCNKCIIKSCLYKLSGDNAHKCIDIRTIEDFPAADVQPVVHGEWIICSDGYYPYCSNCKQEPKGRVMSHFCPYCGADMRGDEDEQAENP